MSFSFTTRAASYIRATLHRYSAFAFVQRILRYADMMLGTAMYNAQQTGLEKQQAVQEKLATLAVYRGDQRLSHRCGRRGRGEPRRSADAESESALWRPRPCVLGVGADDAYHPGSLRRADLRNAGLREFHQPRNRAVAPKVLYD